MEALPTHWLSLVAVVFLLGLKHGLDPDHLAAIDGLTRFNAGRRPVVSRWSGLLFSAGHGVVVTGVAVTVATVAMQWRVPGWLDAVGTWISIAFLAALGTANLLAVLRTPRGEMVRPVGLRSRILPPLNPPHQTWHNAHGVASDSDEVAAYIHALRITLNVTRNHA
jgi:high-affinity nickel-transport protein